MLKVIDKICVGWLICARECCEGGTLWSCVINIPKKVAFVSSFWSILGLILCLQCNGWIQCQFELSLFWRWLREVEVERWGSCLFDIAPFTEIIWPQGGKIRICINTLQSQCKAKFVSLHWNATWQSYQFIQSGFWSSFHISPTLAAN